MNVVKNRFEITKASLHLENCWFEEAERSFGIEGDDIKVFGATIY